MWIDRVTELVPGRRMRAIKNVTLAEEHLHDHFPADTRAGLPTLPVMPASLIVEGMAQTAGILVGHTRDFREKVILAKLSRAVIERDVLPGHTIRYTAEIERIDDTGASTAGTIERLDHADQKPEYETIGRIDLLFSHIDRNLAGLEFPEHNFVFGEGFKNLLRNSGVAIPGE